MKTQDLVIGKFYKDKMSPEKTFVYKGIGTIFTKDYDFDCAERGPVAGIMCTEKQVIKDITPVEVN